MKRESLFETINMKVFVAPAIALIAFIFWGILAPKNFLDVSSGLLNKVCENFVWFMGPAVFAMFIFCMWAAFSKYGSIKLGGEDAVPKMSVGKWFAITLTSGTGAGLCFYGAYSPIQILNNMPKFVTTTNLSERIMLSFEWTYLQWLIHPYSIYTVCGIVMGFIYYNTKRKYRPCEMFYGVLGSKLDGKLGYILDSINIYLIVLGIAVTMGFSTLQTSRGLNVLFGFESNAKTWLMVLTGFTIIYAIAAVSGIEKAVTLISSANMYLYYWIAIWAFIFIDPINIMGLVFQTAGLYISNFVSLSFELEPIVRSGWIAANPIFIYCWWALFAPVMGMFLIKLAYGRTIKQFVLVNLIAPVIFSFFWFTWLGGGAIFIDVFKGGSIYQAISSIGSDVALYELSKHLPLPGVMRIVSFLIVILSFITLGEALAVAIASMTAKNYNDVDGLTKPPSVLVIFWAAILMGVTYIELAAGGMAALQANAVVWGFPILIAMCFMMYGHIKCMLNLKEYDKTGDFHYLNEDPALLYRQISTQLKQTQQQKE